MAKSKSPETDDEKDYQAEMDAHTIMEYQAIQDDDKRRGAAMKCIDRKLKQLKQAKSEAKE